MQCQVPVREWLQARAAELGPHAHMVEVGTYRGETARILASYGARVLAIDTFQGWGLGSPHPHLAEYVVQVSREPSRIVAVLSTSLSAAEAMPDAWADLIFLDASHDVTSVLADLQAWGRVVRAGGYLCGDDWNLDSVREAVTSWNAGEPAILGKGALGGFLPWEGKLTPDNQPALGLGWWVRM